MGYQTVPVPTALLSTHTGGFCDMHFLDLTDSIEKIAEHFLTLGLTFDAIYSGFLGNAAQIDSVEDYIDRFCGENTLVLVDPVMGDDGELYSTYNEELMRRMKRLCCKADVITPNITEAFFLSERDFIDSSDFSHDEALLLSRSLCESLVAFGNKKIVITGIPYDKNRFATYGYDTESKDEFFYTARRIKRSYPGTGDLFASVLLGKLLGGEDFYPSLVFASDFVGRVMEYSSKFDTPVRDGVAFEAFLGELAHNNKL
jgi:pyridoxine kinase